MLHTFEIRVPCSKHVFLFFKNTKRKVLFKIFFFLARNRDSNENYIPKTKIMTIDWKIFKKMHLRKRERLRHCISTLFCLRGKLNHEQVSGSCMLELATAEIWSIVIFTFFSPMCSHFLQKGTMGCDYVNLQQKKIKIKGFPQIFCSFILNLCTDVAA